MAGAHGSPIEEDVPSNRRPPSWELLPAVGARGLRGLAWLAGYAVATVLVEVAIQVVPLALGYHSDTLTARWPRADLEAGIAAAHTASWFLAIAALGVMERLASRRSRELVVDGEWLVCLWRSRSEWEVHIPSVSALRLDRGPRVLGPALSSVQIEIEGPEGVRRFSGVLHRSGALVRELVAGAELTQVTPGEYRPLATRTTDRETAEDRAARKSSRSSGQPPAGRLALRSRTVLWGTVAALIVAGVCLVGAVVSLTGA